MQRVCWRLEQYAACFFTEAYCVAEAFGTGATGFGSASAPGACESACHMLTQLVTAEQRPPLRLCDLAMPGRLLVALQLGCWWSCRWGVLSICASVV